MNDLSEASSEPLSRRLECVVMKFGGTSVEDAAAIRRVCQLASRPSPYRPVLVISALSKVTDQLMNAGWAAAEGRLEPARESLQALRVRHESVASDLLTEEECGSLSRELAEEFQLLDNVLCKIAWEKAFTPQSQDRLLGGGEALSSKLLHRALRAAELDAALVDAKQCIVTDAAHTRATPLWAETNARLNAVLVPLLDAGRVPVMGGFVGATQDGIPTTLGRGGSDFSASIVGAALHANHIEIWTDVDGIMTTDPNLCADARRVARMSFDEAADLAYFGAKVLHPATLVPAMRSNVPVWVLNSRNPEGPGTEIVAHCESSGASQGDHGQTRRGDRRRRTGALVRSRAAARSLRCLRTSPAQPGFAFGFTRQPGAAGEFGDGAAVDCRRTERHGQCSLGKPQGAGLPGGRAGPAPS